MSIPTTPMVNYMVPVVGSTRAVVVNPNLNSGPASISFKDYSLDGVPFRPYGVYIDNTGGTVALNVKINETGMNLRCNAGGILHIPYPAPSEQSAVITGDGNPTLIFVDFPVMPYRSW